MSSTTLSRPLAGLESSLRQLSLQKPQTRCMASITTSTFAYRPPVGKLTRVLKKKAPISSDVFLRKPRIKVPRALPAIKKICSEPIKVFNSREITLLDPTGSRGRLISRTNPDALKVGDVALVRFKSGDPFAGLVMNIRRRGQDSGILMRNELTRVGTEMWVKLYSPLVAGFEIVQRSQRKMRRARAYYFRKPKHDRGSLANLVDQYTKETRRLGRSTAGQTQTKTGAGR